MQGNDVDVCSKISDEEMNAWVNATLALQAGPSKDMAIVTDSPEVRAGWMLGPLVVWPKP